MRAFIPLWLGQSVSLIGSALTSFALGVWVYQETGSVSRLGLVYLLVFLPGILAAPFAGALVDRWDRRTFLLGGALGGMVVTLTLAGLYQAGALRPWHIYVTTAVSSLLLAVQVPAFGASVSLLVPRRQLGRANGMVMLAQSVAQIVGPLAGGFLLGAIHLQGLILLDCASFGFALICLLSIRLPRPPVAAADATAAPHSLLGETAQSWRYIAARQGLVGLLAFYAVLNFAVGFVDVLVTPLVLAFAPTGALGTVLGVGGIGMVLGSVVMTAWGGPRRRVNGVLGFSALLGVALCAGALRPSLPLVGLAAFAFLFCAAIINACNRSIWQAKVEPGLQGRVLALENMVATSTLPAAYLLAGPVTDHVFRPLLGSDSAAADLAAWAVGGGAGRAPALLLLCCGLAILLIAVAGFLYPRLRRVDDELPDAVPEKLAGAAELAPARG